MRYQATERRGRAFRALWRASVLIALAASQTLAASRALAQPILDSAPGVGDSSAADPARAIPAAVPSPAFEAGHATTAPATASPNGRNAVTTRMVRLVSSAQNVVRSGPGGQFSIVGVYPKDRTFPVIAKSGDWYDIRLSDIETGWIHASLCKEFDDLSGLEFRPNPKLYARTGGFILCAYSGAYSFDRKSNSLVLGGRLGYYVFDRIQAEAGFAWTHVRRPGEIVENLFDLSLEAEDFHMVFYNLNLTWELLPGRQMVPFVTGGVGSSIMLGRTEPSVDFGAGTTLFLSKRSAMRWEVRDYRFDSGSDSARRTNNNIEFTLGTLYLY